MNNDDAHTDALRLNDLAKQYGLKFRRVRSTYQFDDFTAHGLKQALGFVEGYDRPLALRSAPDRTSIVSKSWRYAKFWPTTTPTPTK
jgi:hypothetical protein